MGFGTTRRRGIVVRPASHMASASDDAPAAPAAPAAPLPSNISMNMPSAIQAMLQTLEPASAEQQQQQQQQPLHNQADYSAVSSAYHSSVSSQTSMPPLTRTHTLSPLHYDDSVVSSAFDLEVDVGLPECDDTGETGPPAFLADDDDADEPLVRTFFDQRKNSDDFDDLPKPMATATVTPFLLIEDYFDAETHASYMADKAKRKLDLTYSELTPATTTNSSMASDNNSLHSVGSATAYVTYSSIASAGLGGSSSSTTLAATSTPSSTSTAAATPASNSSNGGAFRRRLFSLGKRASAIEQVVAPPPTPNVSSNLLKSPEQPHKRDSTSGSGSSPLNSLSSIPLPTTVIAPLQPQTPQSILNTEPFESGSTRRHTAHSLPKWLLRVWVGGEEEHEIDGVKVRSTGNNPLVDLLLCNSMTVLRHLVSFTPAEDLDDLAKCCVRVFEASQCAAPFLTMTIKMMVDESTSTSTLFRSNSFASKVLSVYCRMIGVDYLQETLGPCVARISAIGRMEVDPDKVAGDESVQENMDKLLVTCQDVFDRIEESVDKFPLRQLCHVIRHEVDLKYPGRGIFAVGAFVFLRYLCPALVSPEKFQFFTSARSRDEVRGMLLVGKTLQNLANGVQFGEKESCMVPANKFLADNQFRMMELLSVLSTLPEGYRAIALPLPSDDALGRIHTLLVTHADKLARELQNQLIVKDMAFVLADDLRILLRTFEGNEQDVARNERFFEQFEEAILSENLLILRSLLSVASISEHEQLTEHLISFLIATDRVTDVLSQLISIQVSEASCVEDLDEYSITSRLLSTFARRAAMDYCKAAFHDLVIEVFDSNKSYKNAATGAVQCEDLEISPVMLATFAMKFLGVSFGVLGRLPLSLQCMCRFLFAAVDEKFPGHGLAVATKFLYVQFFGAAIASPSYFGITGAVPDMRSHRMLGIISSAFHHLAYCTHFEDPSMRELNMALDYQSTCLKESMGKLLRPLTTLMSNGRRQRLSIFEQTNPEPVSYSQRFRIYCGLQEFLAAHLSKMEDLLAPVNRIETISYNLFDRVSLVLSVVKRLDRRIVVSLE